MYKVGYGKYVNKYTRIINAKTIDLHLYPDVNKKQKQNADLYIYTVYFKATDLHLIYFQL